jgi:transcriptional regulator with XRE-family HTH domain
MVIVMSRPHEEDWDRLASYVTSARLAAGFRDIRTFAAATGITERTLGKLERGERVSAATLAVVADHVGWTPDSPRSVLAGREPVPASGGERPDAAEIPAGTTRHDDPPAPLPADDTDLMQMIPMPEELREAARPYAVKFHRLYVEAVARTGSTDPPGDEVFEPRSWEAQSWDMFRRQFPDTLRRLGIIAGASLPDDRSPGQRHDSAAGLTASGVALERRGGGAA